MRRNAVQLGINKITRLMAMEWSRTLQYRFDTVAWMTAETAIPLVSFAIWYSVSKNSSLALTPQEITTYYIAVMAVKIFTDAWNGVFMSQAILNGDIVKYLIRPMSVFWEDLMNNVLEKALKVIILAPLLIMALWLLPNLFTSSVYEPTTWLFFVVSVLVAALLNFWIDSLFGILVFWLEDTMQIRSYKSILEVVASGVFVPLILFPSTLQTAFNFLPFRYIIAAPAEILSGQVPHNMIGYLILQQLGWLGVAFIVAMLMWRTGIKRYAVPGQ